MNLRGATWEPRVSGEEAGQPSSMKLAVLVLLAAVLAALGVSVDPVSVAVAQQRRIVVVGDSILLGARDQLAQKYTQLGWAATLDMEVSRSTLAGLRAIEAHAFELTDTLVIGLGANDAGNTDTFRRRVQQVLDAVVKVPHVYWVTIAEARPYYPAANQVLRDEAARRPNVSVIEWAAHAAGTDSVTGSDGLHLTPKGAVEMANLVVFATALPAPATEESTDRGTPEKSVRVPSSIGVQNGDAGAAATTTVPDSATSSTTTVVASGAGSLADGEDPAVSGDEEADPVRAARSPNLVSSETTGDVPGYWLAMVVLVLGVASAVGVTWWTVSSRRSHSKS